MGLARDILAVVNAVDKAMHPKCLKDRVARRVSRFEAVFISANREVQKKRSALAKAERELARWTSALGTAAQTFAKRERNWMEVGSPGTSAPDVGYSQNQFDDRRRLCTRLKRAIRRIRRKLLYLKAANACRQFSAGMNQPWYVLCTVAGGTGFALLALVAFLFINSLWWNIGLGVAGFFGTFLCSAFLHLYPSEGELQRWLWQLDVVEQANATDLAKVRKSLELAKLKLEYDKAWVCLAECQRWFDHSSAECERARQEYIRVREASSRKNCLLSSDWSSLKGQDFETFLQRVFEELGFQVETTPVTGDHGVDLIARKGSTRIAIQAKGYPNCTVGNDAVQQAFSGMAIYKCSSCAVITNSFFTAHARDAATRLQCLLVEHGQMEQLIYGRIAGLN